MTPTLDDAIWLAINAHRGQVDKSGQPFILHPMRVMCKMDNDHDRMVAVLHDVIEDTDWTYNGLMQAGYPKTVVYAVEAMTRHKSESYPEYITRVIRNPHARHIKMRDIEDNTSIDRMLVTDQRDIERLRRYKLAWDRLWVACG